jgi:gluconokinase
MEHIWIITGPAGCGKTTVAQYLAKELSLPYVEGDDVWPPVPGGGARD